MDPCTDEVRKAAPKAKVLKGERVRFEVAGGYYRLVAAFDFRRQIAFVEFVGTHASISNCYVECRWLRESGNRWRNRVCMATLGLEPPSTTDEA